jgi:hypothetical protein
MLLKAGALGLPSLSLSDRGAFPGFGRVVLSFSGGS